MAPIRALMELADLPEVSVATAKQTYTAAATA